jgi:hypothetical protein
MKKEKNKKTFSSSFIENEERAGGGGEDENIQKKTLFLSFFFHVIKEGGKETFLSWCEHEKLWKNEREKISFSFGDWVKDEAKERKKHFTLFHYYFYFLFDAIRSNFPPCHSFPYYSN